MELAKGLPSDFRKEVTNPKPPKQYMSELIFELFVYESFMTGVFAYLKEYDISLFIGKASQGLFEGGNKMINFADIAVGAIGIGVTVMVGYLVVAQVRAALNTTDAVANAGMTTAQSTVFAGFSLIAVGIIVLAAYGLIAVFSS